jgi:hypothetical protein
MRRDKKSLAAKLKKNPYFYRVPPYWNFFIYIFYLDFAKLYGPPEILHNYTSAPMAHSVRDRAPRPLQEIL